MTDYKAPLDDMLFNLESEADLHNWTSLPAYADASKDLVTAILEEAAKLTGELIAPTNKIADLNEPKLENNVVTVPDEIASVMAAYVEGGWQTLQWPVEFGGQALPQTLAFVFQEMLSSANMAFSLNSMLSMGAMEAIFAHGSDEIKAKYLPKMVTGEWCGSMNLTEPQAGSDVGALTSKAEKMPDGSYRIKGQKIFITWGDHELSENIIHLVLARLPDSPAGTKGISLFIVPKYLVEDDGTIGARNDVKCVSLEEKLGIHGSPTCVMSFGDEDSCIGYLCGEENRGMASMFTMMNNARLGVGQQGMAVGERAYQASVAYATDRVQSAAIDVPSNESVTIVHHADVRRMLMTQRAYIQAARAIQMRNIWALDRAHVGASEQDRKTAKAEADLLTPMSKSFGTEIGCHVASLAVQVCGGMGYIEETGVAQYYRDVRITPIYEGTNGIQALDLVGRKLNMDGGEHWRALIAEMKAWAQSTSMTDSLPIVPLLSAIECLEDAAEYLFALGHEKIRDVAGAATPFQRIFSVVLGGYLLAKQAELAAQRISDGVGNPDFMQAKIATANFYLEQLLPEVYGLIGPVKASSDSLFALNENMLAS